MVANPLRVAAPFLRASAVSALHFMACRPTKRYARCGRACRRSRGAGIGPPTTWACAAGAATMRHADATRMAGASASAQPFHEWPRRSGSVRCGRGRHRPRQGQQGPRVLQRQRAFMQPRTRDDAEQRPLAERECLQAAAVAGVRWSPFASLQGNLDSIEKIVDVSRVGELLCELVCNRLPLCHSNAT